MGGVTLKRIRASKGGGGRGVLTLTRGTPVPPPLLHPPVCHSGHGGGDEGGRKDHDEAISTKNEVVGGMMVDGRDESVDEGRGEMVDDGRGERSRFEPQWHTLETQARWELEGKNTR